MHLTFSKQSSCQSCFVACVVTVFLICGVLIVPRKPARFVTVHAGACSEKPPWLEQYFLCNAHSLSGRHVWQAPPSISLNNLFTMREPVCPPRLFMHPSETHNPPKPSQTLLHTTKHPVIELRKLPNCTRDQASKKQILNPVEGSWRDLYFMGIPTSLHLLSLYFERKHG